MSVGPRINAGHDFAAKWPKAPDWQSEVIEFAGIRVSAQPGLQQILVSGDLKRAISDMGVEAEETGLWDICRAGSPVLVRISRDRGLLVSNASTNFDEGWNQAGWCATDMSDAWRVLDIDGDRLEDLISRGVSADFRALSPSAAVLFAGIDVLLYRTTKTRARVHVDAPLAPYLWRWVEEQAKIR